ncbi:hypothetical protein DERF_008676 [Dermatophagoides farinae]|uniref:Uncharacterized protein n=1 Tax=Dermatophagoides farinae TaxID=6954 RepID=A0A922I1F3_DERFA|nr:hypothetical protein DERF_008676 [Dermatophagoides farinae]
MILILGVLYRIHHDHQYAPIAQLK